MSARTEHVEENIAVVASTGKKRYGVQVTIAGLLAVIAFLGGYALLYSDRHNDTRYVSLSSYAADQAEQAREAAKDAENSAKFHALEQAAINSKLDDLSKRTDEISGDVKTLLRSRYSQRPQDQ